MAASARWLAIAFRCQAGLAQAELDLDGHGLADQPRGFALETPAATAQRLAWIGDSDGFADVAVVDIPTANPSVFCELGARHALRDRVTVLIRRKGTGNPFNIGGMTTIAYGLDQGSAERAREAIASFVASVLLSGARDSLVQAVLPGLKAGRDPQSIIESRIEEFDVPGSSGKLLGSVRGKLRDVNLGNALAGRPIEIWVNAQNISMQMARPQDASVFGLIRHLGARRDDTGNVVEDTIANELNCVRATPSPACSACTSWRPTKRCTAPCASTWPKRGCQRGCQRGLRRRRPQTRQRRRGRSFAAASASRRPDANATRKARVQPVVRLARLQRCFTTAALLLRGRIHRDAGSPRRRRCLASSNAPPASISAQVPGSGTGSGAALK